MADMAKWPMVDATTDRASRQWRTRGRRRRQWMVPPFSLSSSSSGSSSSTSSLVHLIPPKFWHGDDDKFLHDQLLPRNFEEAAKAVNVPLVLRMQPGYDHSYFFIATFIEDHIHHHAQALKSQ